MAVRFSILLSTALVGLLLAVSNPLSAATVTGVILRDKMGGPPIASVRVGIRGGDDPVSTPLEGTFVLKVDKNPGEPVQLIVQKQGMVVVNYFELRFTLPKSGNPAPLTLILCLTDERQEMVRRYYSLDRADPIDQDYGKKLDDLEAKNQATEAARERLRSERDRAKEAELCAAEQLAREKVEEVVDYDPRFSSHRSDAVMALNSLGMMYRRRNRVEEARTAFDEALRISRKLALQDRDTYLPDVEETLNNLGNLLGDQNQDKETQAAQESYNEALKISSELAEQKPITYLPDVASTQDNLGKLFIKQQVGIFFSKQRQLADAREGFEAALGSYRNLTKLNESRATYVPNVAKMLTAIGILNHDQDLLEDARIAFGEALTKYQALASENPGQYAPEIESTYRRLLETNRKLAEQKPAAYRRYLATTLSNFGTFLRSQNQNRMEEVRQYYDDALKIYRALAREKISAYLPDVADMLHKMGSLYLSQDRTDEAEKVFHESFAVEALAVGASIIGVSLIREEREKFSEISSIYDALEISPTRAEQGPAKYLPKVAIILRNIGISSRDSGPSEVAKDGARKAFNKTIDTYEELALPETYRQEIESTRKLLADLDGSTGRQATQTAIAVTRPAVPRITVKLVLARQREICKAGSYKPGSNSCPVTAKIAESLDHGIGVSRAYPLSAGKLISLPLEPRFHQALTADIETEEYAVLLEVDLGNTHAAIVDLVREENGKQSERLNAHWRAEGNRWFTHENAEEFDPDKGLHWRLTLDGKLSFRFCVSPSP